MSARTKILSWVILLFIIDLAIPLPITGVILLVVAFQRPAWFLRAVLDVYGGH